MSYKKIQKRRKRKKITGFIAVILIAYLFLKPTINIISGGFKTTLPSQELLVESVKGEGFFIRNEKVVESDAKGILKRSVDEGQRIGAGIEVASIESVKDNSHLEREILEIEQAIETLEKSEAKIDILKDEKIDIQKLQRDKLEEIQNKIIKEEYSNINITKEELSLYEKKQKDVNFPNQLASESIEKLKSRRDKIKEEISSDNRRYYTQNGGIISYKVDGYEEIYTSYDLENYTYKKLNSDEYLKQSAIKDENLEDETEISIGQPIYKILDDFEWYVAIKIDNIKDIIDISSNQTVKLHIDGDASKIKGKIVNINRSNNTAVVVVKFDTMMYKFYHMRIAKVELIKSETNTFKIPKRTLVKKDKQEGVYIKNKGGIVEFKPVFEIKEIGEYVYIHTGDNASNVSLGEETVKTITLFDEVILNTKNVKEGDIID